MEPYTKKMTALLLVVVVAASILLAASIMREGRQWGDECHVIIDTYDSPIRINSNQDFEEYSKGGDGSEENPWVLENHNIDGAESGYCIYIGNTTDHFVVRNNFLHNASGNMVSGHYRNSGLYLYNVTNGIITGNVIEHNTLHGIYLRHSNLQKIYNNTAAFNGWYGIYLEGARDCTIRGNNVSENQLGNIKISSWSSNNKILDNRITGRSEAIHITFSKNTVLQHNTMTTSGINIDGYDLEHFTTHSISESNTVNDKPVYYWKDRTGGTVPEGAGQIILANCTGVAVEDQNMRDGTVGVLLGFSNKNTITDSTFSTITYGVNIIQSEQNNISQNSFSRCSFAIHLQHFSNMNNIKENKIHNNTCGIYQTAGENNTIKDNDIYKNDKAIELFFSEANTILDNTLLDNNDSITIYFRSDNNSITGNTVSNTSRGIQITHSNNNTIDSNTMSFCGGSINIYTSGNNTIRRNNISQGLSTGASGIYLYDSGNNTILDNNILNKTWGISLVQSRNNNIGSNILEGVENIGIHIAYSSNNNSLWGNNILGSYTWGMEIHQSRENTLENNTITECMEGIHLSNSQWITLKNNSLDKKGITLDGDSLEHLNTHHISGDNTVGGKPVYYWKDRTGGTVPGGAGQIILVNCSMVVVEDQNIGHSSTGIHVELSNNITIRKNTAYNNTRAINIVSSKTNTIVDNTLFNNLYAIKLSQSEGSRMKSNTASNNSYGILLEWESNNNIIHDNVILDNIQGIGIMWHSRDNTMEKNMISNNIKDGYMSYGIYISFASNNSVLGNTLSIIENGDGIAMHNSWNIALRNNTMIQCGISIFGFDIEAWNTHSISESNTVNGKPVYYWKDRTGGTVPGGAGQIILANCSMVVVEDQNLRDGTVGVLLGFSNNNTIRSNTADSNNIAGFWLSESRSNTLSNNTLSNNTCGIYMDGKSNNNTLTRNTIMDNQDGIQIRASNNNIVYHNNLLSNNRHAYDTGNNQWDNGDEGNHWDDYTGEDSGEGVGTTPVTIPGRSNTDRHPLMLPLQL